MVVANKSIEEGACVHARVGDVGQVLEKDGDWLTVAWGDRGTIADCHVSELYQVQPGKPLLSIVPTVL